MRLAQLHVKNFRNLGDVTIALTSGTVVVGENRAGKSNLVHALRLVLDPTLSSSQRMLQREDFWDGLSDGSAGWDPMTRGNVIEVSVEIDDIGEDANALAILAGALIEGEPMRARLTYRFGPRDDIDQPAEGMLTYDWGIYGGVYEERLGTDMRRYLHHVHLGALRDVNEDLTVWRRSPLRALIEAAAADTSPEDLTRVGDAMTTANDLVESLDTVAGVAKDISAEMERFVGRRQALETTLGLTAPEPWRILRSLRLFVDGDSRRHLGAASLGGLNVLYLALLELQLERELARHQMAHVVLSIEEPEAHLHPHTQRLAFSRLLREEPDRTVLVTTHSPHIVSVTPPRQLVVLRNDGVQSRAASAATAELTEEEWADLGRYLDATRGEMVFANRVVLVEGYGEQVLLPMLAESMGYSLDRQSISICPVHGTHFATYVRFLDALCIPWVVVTDGDMEGTDPTSRAGLRRAQLLCQLLGRSADNPHEAGVFVGMATLEKDIYDSSQENAKACRDAVATLNRNAANRIDAANGDSQVFYEVIVRRKGRFAQRLAALRASVTAPQYISDALHHLVRL